MDETEYKKSEEPGNGEFSMLRVPSIGPFCRTVDTLDNVGTSATSRRLETADSPVILVPRLCFQFAVNNGGMAVLRTSP
jgi:hypothetical protein